MRTMFRRTIPIFLFAVYLLTITVSCESKPKRYTVVYLDLDGTALDTTREVRVETIKAVRTFKEQGGRVGIATGRTLEQAKKAIKDIVPNLPIVLYNGGMTADARGKNLKVLGNVDSETMQTCIKILSNHPDVNGLILHYPTVSISDRNSPRLVEFATNHDITLTFRSDLFNLSSDSLIKILALCPAERTERVRDTLKSAIPMTSRVVIGSPVAVEVLPVSISKGAAIKRIATEVGFSMEDLVAFGDSGNDIEMLKDAALGVAMWNGRQEAHDAADLIIGPNYSDAIAKFLVSPVMK